MMTRIDIINYFIKKYNYKSYLEIGVQNGVSFSAIDLPLLQKIGVDPDPNSQATLHKTSDQYFDLFRNVGVKHDIIFIDGLHEADQVYKDLINALDFSKDTSTIICHDMNPLTELAQRVPRETKVWNGDCWKAFVRLKRERPDLEMRVVDTDHGCGIIRRAPDNIFYGTTDQQREVELTYSNFEIYKRSWLDLISVEDFPNIY